MDLWSKTADRNGLPMNPHWTLQDESPALPTLDGCAFDGLNHLTCSGQQITTEELEGARFTCQPTRLKPHVNWGAATYTGVIDWDSWDWNPDLLKCGFDDDFNFALATPNRSGYTADNAERERYPRTDSDHLPGYGLEMQFAETLAHARSGWWSGFKEAIEDDQLCYQMRKSDRGFQCKEGNAAAMLQGPDNAAQRYAIATGLANLDCVHGCRAELHPLYSLAIRVEEENRRGVRTERWALFARNWGSEGKCGTRLHFPGGRLGSAMTIELPWQTGDRVEVDLGRTTARTNSEFIRQHPPQVTYAQGIGVFVTLTFPDAKEYPLVDTDLYLCWGKCPVTAIKKPREGGRAGKAGTRLMQLQRDHTRADLASELGEKLGNFVMRMSDPQFESLLAKAIDQTRAGGQGAGDDRLDARIRQAQEVRVPTPGAGPFTPLGDVAAGRAACSADALKKKLIQFVVDLAK